MPSVRDRDGALDVEYDETIIGENKLVEISRTHQGEVATPATLAHPTSNTGMGPTR